MIKVGNRTLHDRFEVADMFGVAPRTLNWRVNHGHFPHPVRVANRPYWYLTDIVRYLDELEPAE